MERVKITFIGGGNMACSLVGGLLSGGFNGHGIVISDPDSEKAAALRQRFPNIEITNNNVTAASGADVIVMAVKPQRLKMVAQELAPALNGSDAFILSIAAGIREADLNQWLGGDRAVVRTMPNTPALIQSGATALYANQQVSESQRGIAESIMRAVGLTLWLDDEAQMDVVTALSGSGPAYFFLIMEALEDAACQLGLDRESARLLTLQTAFGATKMALESDESCATLRAQVTSPGGTTEQAIKAFEDGGLRALFDNAVSAAHQRSIELANQLGNSRNG
ncbi:MAG: pyrroline-5-carboxylate reductase [Gammaproteobacteria bacterium]|nr:pyrroline-5-carboxylate reductase [Gammaproteobacteria bacterium]